ncbi:MAG: hypothetical protein HOM55_00325 [Proteobacteria bacterium]|nr:hypothetical protein [Pseudomonadota bacterium]
MLQTLFKVLVLALIDVIPLGALAHHSDTGLDLDSEVMLEGVVTKVNWRNPHIYFVMQVTDQGGQPADWTIQMASIPWLARRGWTSDSVAVGDELFVRAHPAVDGRDYGVFVSIEKGGVRLPKNNPVELGAGSVVATATTLEGTWLGDRSTIGDFTEFFDRLVTSEKGAIARNEFDALSTMNPMSSCGTRPTPATLVSAGGYLEEIEFVDDSIILRNEIFDTERIVYMDGRAHPEDGERTPQGHSTGEWEGDVLVVDTVAFADHRSPYQNGIPSGAQKHVVEKYWLNEDGTRIILEMMLEDPEYLTTPLTDTMEWVYAPDQEMIPWNCDRESTQGFVTH